MFTSILSPVDSISLVQLTAVIVYSPLFPFPFMFHTFPIPPCLHILHTQAKKSELLKG